METPAGEKLFKALRELEVAFLNDAGTVKTGLTVLMKKYDVPISNYVTKYLFENSIVKHSDQSTKREPIIYWNGPRVSVQYCNELLRSIRDMKNDSRRFDIKGEIKSMKGEMMDIMSEIEILQSKYNEKKIIFEYLNKKL